MGKQWENMMIVQKPLDDNMDTSIFRDLHIKFTSTFSLYLAWTCSVGRWAQEMAGAFLNF